MKNIKLTIEYDGTNFFGWQKQPNGERTVQSEIERVVLLLFKESPQINASGRTDRGVHAFGQVVSVQVETTMKKQTILKAMNANLPDDIAVLSVEFVDLNFHARFSAKQKTYQYQVLNRISKTALNRNHCLLYPYQLDLEKMGEAAQYLIGEHDFFTFQGSHPEQKLIENPNTIRGIFNIQIKKDNDFIFIDVTGNGFLYKMVRNIVGTLLYIGSGKLEPKVIKTFFQKKDKSLIPITAKPHGLFLKSVEY